MASITALESPTQADSATVQLFGDRMSQLNVVLDELAVYPWATKDKLQKAYEAVLEERVSPAAQAGVFQVGSAQAAEGVYLVQDGICNCPYGGHHPSERYGCYHGVAARLYARWQQNLTPLTVPPVMKESPMPVDAPTMAEEPPIPRPLPETLSLPLRSITAIVADLSRPLPADCVATKTVKGTPIAYLHWQTVARMLDTYAAGWQGEVTRLEQHGATLRVTYRLQLLCAEGMVSREATGEDDEWEATEENRYGNPSANAQANAFKRAAALFGCGQWLYDKANDPTAKALAAHFKQEKGDALALLGKALVQKGLSRVEALAWLKQQAGVTNLGAIPLGMLRTMVAQVAQENDVQEVSGA